MVSSACPWALKQINQRQEVKWQIRERDDKDGGRAGSAKRRSKTEHLKTSRGRRERAEEEVSRWCFPHDHFLPSTPDSTSLLAPIYRHQSLKKLECDWSLEWPIPGCLTALWQEVGKKRHDVEEEDEEESEERRARWEKMKREMEGWRGEEEKVGSSAAVREWV